MRWRAAAAAALRDLPLGVHERTPAWLRTALRHRLGRYYAWEAEFDFHAAPPLRPGEGNGPPDFVGIGVQKAGTSWWYQLVMDHPGVSAPRRSIHKERHFFGRFGTQRFGAADIDDYHRWFPRLEGTITGEWTPDYFHYAWAPPLLAQAAPRARLLLLLRDPVERFRSGYAHQIRNGADHAGASVAEALGRSLYADALRRWQEHFPPEQLLVLQYERCVAAPAEELARTYGFLGLSAEHRPAYLDRLVNETVEGKRPLDEDVRRRLGRIFAPDVAELGALTPGLDLTLWPGTDA